MNSIFKKSIPICLFFVLGKVEIFFHITRSGHYSKFISKVNLITNIKKNKKKSVWRKERKCVFSVTADVDGDVMRINLGYRALMIETVLTLVVALMVGGRFGSPINLWEVNDTIT